jgi:RNA-binding protein
VALTPAQRRHLRGIAHGRKPVVWIAGHGLSEGVRRELEAALDTHELVKVSIRVGDRKMRDAVAAEIVSVTGAEAVQRIGNVVTLYRANAAQPRLALPPG